MMPRSSTAMLLATLRSIGSRRSRTGSVRFRSGGGGSSSSSYAATGPSKSLKSWESGARLVQNTTVENRYLEHIRDVHDPSQHLKTIEDELKGTIGKALGKQGKKVLMYAELMRKERVNYERLVREEEEGEASSSSLSGEKNTTTRKQQREAAARAHNEYRKECLHARWELIVHRQAVGFTVGNHRFVHEKFPIGDALPVDGGGDGEHDGDENGGETDEVPPKPKPKPKAFTDQLDWWSRIGRWK